MFNFFRQEVIVIMDPNIAKKTIKLVVDILKREGWKISSGTNGEYCYAAPDGRTSTICLHQYESPQFWRWHIDRLQVRIRGGSKMVAPTPPKGLCINSELTVYENELTEPFAQWLADWMIVANNKEELPACPVLLSSGKTYQGGYDWSVKAQAEYNNKHA